MKKTLAMVLALALLCVLAVNSTLSYFTDTAAAANTMTVGKVDIEQIEQKHDENGALVNLAANADGVTSLGRLYPYTGGAAVDGWFSTANNAMDKIVTVKNTGSEAAYVRTLFAFEAVNGADPIATSIIQANFSGPSVGALKAETTTPIKVKGVQYFVYSFTYDAALASGATSAASLKQFYLDSSVGNGFADAIGGSYEILVISQAVQTQGFAAAGGKTAAQVALDTAFGEVNAANAATWFN